MSLIQILFIILFGLVSLPTLGIANDEVFQIDSATKSINLSPLLEYTQSTEHQTLPTDIPHHQEWLPIESSQINLGFKDHGYWFRGSFETKELKGSDWVLEQPYPLIDELKIYIYKDTQLEYEWETGDTKPFSERPLQHARFLFPLVLENNARYELYVYAKNTEAMELPLRLSQYNEFTTLDNKSAVIDGIFYGFLIIMAAYNLVLFLNIRDQSYLYYVTYVLSMLFFFMSQKGLLYQFFFPSSPTIHHYSIPLILVFTIHSIGFFFKNFLQLPQRTPISWKVIKAVLIFNVVIGVAMFFIPYKASIFLILGNTAFASLFGLYIAIHLSMQGVRTAQMLLGGWSLLIICIVFMTLSKVGIIYNQFMADYGLRLGTSFEILIFSFALSYRINEERRAKEAALKQANQERSERIRAQDMALQHEVEARKAKEDALEQQKLLNENLEQLVHERTATLEKTLVDLEKANKELEQLSSKDGLTGLFNRRSFDNRSEEEWSRSNRENIPLSLLMLDIDHFKKINDTKGHQCGDYVLKELSKLMTEVVSRPTDVIARYGGEEFAILLQNTPKSGAEHIAGALVTHASQMNLNWEGIPFTITISVGTHSVIANQSLTLDSLISAADGALYNAKQNGRNQWVSVS